MTGRQQTVEHPDRVETAPAVIRRLIHELGRSRYAVAKEAGIELANIRRAHRNFSRADAEALLTLIADSSIRNEFERRFHEAELLRKAVRQTATPPKIDPQLPDLRLLLNEAGRGQSRRTGDKSAYWSRLFFALQLESGDEPVRASVRSLRPLYVKYVAEIRIAKGEVPAFYNALILMNAYLATAPFGSTEERHALLGIFFAAIDLAAQINDYRWLGRLAKTLADLGIERFPLPAERFIWKRLILDTRSRAHRYSPGFDQQAHVRKQAEDLALAATEDASSALQTIGALAHFWPELTTAWLGSYFGLLNHGINAGWAAHRLDQMLNQHDAFASELAVKTGGPVIALTCISDAAAAADPYAAEFLATRALARENPAHNLKPRSHALRSAFDPDKALSLTRQALTLADPDNHYGDSIQGGLLLAHAEAMLCKATRPMPCSLRDEYEAARQGAADIFQRLGMSRKLHRLNSLELRAGLIRRVSLSTTRL